MRTPLTPLLLVLLALAIPSPSWAQIDKSVALGGGIGFYFPFDDDARSGVGPSLAYRFGKPERWRPMVAFNWFATTFDGNVGETRVELGDLRIRPVMGGYGYTVKRGPLAATFSAVGGIAFNSFDPTGNARVAYAESADRVLLDITASNTPAARTEVALWYDLNTRIGILVAFGYIVTRPEIDIVTDVGTETRRLKADALKLQFGVAYGIF